MRNRTLLLAVGLALFSARPVLALDEVTYESLIDKDKAKVGENVQYMVVVHFGLDTMTPTVLAPTFNQFTVLNENQSVQATPDGPDKHFVFKKIWLLQPEAPGRLSIASALINYQDPTTNLLKTGKTGVQLVEVAPVADDGAITPSTVERMPAGKPSAPLWMYVLAVGAGLGILIVALPRRKPSTLVASRVAPEDQALDALQQALAHLEREDLGAYYTALTRSLLEYLQAKFGLDANVLSTSDLLQALNRLGFGPDIRSRVELFFQVAEKAKFAGYVPGEEEMIALHKTAKIFIESGRKLEK